MITGKRLLQAALVTLLCAVWCGCQTPQRYQRAAGPYTTYEQEQGQQHPLCAFGMPERESGWDHGPTVTADRPGYVLEHGSRDKVPLWVCERVVKKHLKKKANRKKSRFKPDPRLRPGERAELADYRGSGYDRGHQAPAADFKYSQDRMNDSFYLSNMAPQVGIGFNRHIWSALEGRVRDAVRNRGEVFVITGGMFYDPDEEQPETADGFVEFEVIGPNQVSVPTHFYKIVVAKNADGEWQAIGFVLENRAYPRAPGGNYDFAPFVQAIDWIEERAGINFMPLLDEDDRALEERLERNPAELWWAFRNN
jgi:endonuclease G